MWPAGCLCQRVIGPKCRRRCSNLLHSNPGRRRLLQEVVDAEGRSPVPTGQGGGLLRIHPTGRTFSILTPNDQSVLPRFIVDARPDGNLARTLIAATLACFGLACGTEPETTGSISLAVARASSLAVDSWRASITGPSGP